MNIKTQGLKTALFQLYCYQLGLQVILAHL